MSESFKDYPGGIKVRTGKGLWWSPIFSGAIYFLAALYLAVNFRDDSLGGPNVFFAAWLLVQSFLVFYKSHKR